MPVRPAVWPATLDRVTRGRSIQAAHSAATGMAPPCVLRVSAAIRLLRRPPFLYSRIFSTATRSSASSFLRTMSADTSAPPMMPRKDQATAWRDT